MKPIKTTLLLICVLIFSHLNGQIVDKLKSFYVVYGLSVPTAFYYYDSVSITSLHPDTTAFSTITQGNSGVNTHFIKRGQKIYKDDSTLLYDYNLTEGDTFLFNYFGIRDTFFVRNVFDSTLKSRSHKVWRLVKSGNAYPSQILWVEGLGSLVYGWDYSTYLMSDGTPVLKAWCVDDSLLLWDTSAYYPPHRVPAETCDFRMLSKTLDIPEKAVAPTVRIYPVPVGQQLNINLGALFSGHAEVYNSLGQVLISEHFDVADRFTLTLPQYSSHYLFVRITYGAHQWVQLINSIR